MFGGGERGEGGRVKGCSEGGGYFDCLYTYEDL